MRRLTSRLVLALLTAGLLGQEPHTFDPLGECPFVRTSLRVNDPAAVSWACEQIAARNDHTATAEESRDLLAALRRYRDEKAAAAQRAVLHVLHAMREARVSPTRADLNFAAEDGRTEIARLDLLLRTASPEGGELFTRFQQLEPDADVAWEVLGGALALRQHRAFAAELWLGLRPTLRIAVGGPVRTDDEGSLLRSEAPAPMDSFPLPPVYYWRRDTFGLPYADWKRAYRGDSGVTFPEARPSSVIADRARIRWVATLAGLPEAKHMPDRFELEITYWKVETFAECSTQAQQRANAGLTEIAAALRDRQLLPAGRGANAPELLVKCEDLRSQRQKTEKPLPGTK